MADAILAQSGIYAITNIVNGQQYIGSAVKFRRRFAVHLCHLRSGQHHSQKLQKAWNKYGETAFRFEVLEIVDDHARLIQVEQSWLDKTKVASRSGYNISPTAGSPLGTRHSAETKRKISLSQTVTPRVISDETRKKISEANRGRVMSPETKDKIRAANTGRERSDDARARLRAAGMGRKMSDETREKMRVAHIGRKNSPETIEKMRQKKSPEAIAKREATKRAKRLSLNIP